MAEPAYEKLGAFYLGRLYDSERQRTTDTPVLYDSRDLTTHAVCVGMTGSGKTGLCVSLIEEAAIDGIPALVIDPKGDLGNLLLTFPDLRGEDFAPWVDPEAAAREGTTLEAFAAGQAETWRAGLAAWGQDAGRIRRLREAADFAIYTPGSSAGLSVSILDSFAPPAPAECTDAELVGERVATTVSGLLGLLGIEGDPLGSREHVLLATILDAFWRQGRTADLATLIHAVQSPPVERIGVMPVDSFFPEKDRFALATRLNALLAAPGFRQWQEGDPLDVARLLHTPAGKPRVAIFSIAHLSESERMFFVTLLLNQVLGWMRSRPGTSSLRALVYMDEIFGYLPPSAEPPSKRPLLTLLKQARAYGVGLVLATQNPVDLDYKALSNAGTWFLGRLQTERDKLRVLDGLEGASGGRLDRPALERTLSGLGQRVFLLHNVHEDAPVLFQTRWAMSYLRGPMTREQVRALMSTHKGGSQQAAATRAAAASPERAAHPTGAAAGGAPGGSRDVGSVAAGPASDQRPVLPSAIEQVFVPVRTWSGGGVSYRPALIGFSRVRYIDARTKRSKHVEESCHLVQLDAGGLGPDWNAAEAIDLVPEDLERAPVSAARWESLPQEAARAANFARWGRALADQLYRTRSLALYRSPGLDLTSEPGESEGDFRVRIAERGREQRDRDADALRRKYARRVNTLQDRIRRAGQAVEREREQASGQQVETAISLGATVLGALIGRRRLGSGTVGRAASTARGLGRAAKEGQDIRRAEENVAALRQELAALEAELQAELNQLEDRYDPMTEALESSALRPRKSDVEVRLVALAWVPFAAEGGGSLYKA